MKWVTYNAATLGFSVALVVFGLVGAVMCLSTMRLVESAAWVDHTYQVRQTLADLANALLNAESGRRGFVMTGDESELERFRAASAAAKETHSTLRSLTTDNADQQGRLQAIEPQLARRLALLGESVELRKAEGFESPQQLAFYQRGRSIAAELGNLLREMDDEERVLLARRQAGSAENFRYTVIIMIFGAVVSMALFVGSFSAVRREIIRRRQAEVAVSETNVFLNSVIENIPNMIVVKDAPDLRFVRVNRAGEALLGYPRADLIGKSDYDLFPKDEADVFTEKDRAVVCAKAPVDIAEERIRARNKSERILHTKRVPILSANGALAFLLCISEDITERKQMEEALRESEDRYRDLFEHASDLIQSVAPDGRFLYVNPAWRETLGYSEQEVKQLSFLDVVHPDSRAHCMDTFARLMAGDPVASVEAVFLTHDGRSIQVEGTTSCRTIDGKPAATRGIFRDVTKRRAMEAAVRLSEGRWRRRVENASDYIAEFDTEGRLLYASPNHKKLGYTQEELVGRSALEFVHPEDAEEAGRVFAAALTTEQEPIVVRFRQGDGRFCWFETGWQAFTAEDGTSRLLAVSRDITERKLATERIARLNADLRDRADQLTQANQELESFSYSVSHDLRAPLRAIDGFSRALLRDCANTLDSQGTHYLERVRAGTQRMGELIDDLLSLARITRGELRRETVDLSALARAIATELSATSVERHVEFVIAEGLQATGDRRLLRVALENLLGNAWKYTSKHPAARIEVGVTTQNGAPVYFVRDDGAGFDMAYAAKLFGAFQRLHGTREFEGSGIGLANVQRIIHRHGGRIWAEAVVEQGAIFYFTL